MPASAATAIVTGDAHTCALREGRVQCWGDNSMGQLGTGDTIGSAVPVYVPGLAGVTGISAGAHHTCALLSAGSVQCWGANDDGQLGSGAYEDALSPSPVTNLASGVTFITSGAKHNCALQNGAAFCWGAGNSGQLGNNGTQKSPVPVAVTQGSGVISISAGRTHTCAIGNGAAFSQVRCWGTNGSGELGDGTNVPRKVPTIVPGISAQVIAAGNAFTCAVATGSAVCWGAGGFGQLGNGGTGGSPTPVQVQGLVAAVQAISLGNAHACAAILNPNQVRNLRCWGYNASGELGSNNTSNASSPASVTLPSGAHVGAFDLGAAHTCAVVDEVVKCWGSDDAGQLGVGTIALVPTPLELPIGIKSASMGGQHGCGLLTAAGGGAVCWGGNRIHQLGDGTATDDPLPGTVSGLGPFKSVTEIDAGIDHACAIVAGAINCWGKNASGQLGNGNTTPQSVPAAVVSFPAPVQKISAGSQHTCAIKNGAARCWGNGADGRLGTGNTNPTSTPTAVAFTDPTGNANLTSISAGTAHTCAVRAGAAFCWGDNLEAQVGDGFFNDRNNPVPVSGLANGVTSIAAGSTHSCAVVNGAAKCWGKNQYGTLGNGTTLGTQTPGPVDGLDAGVTMIAAAGSATCAVVDGGVKCWGIGVLGDGLVRGFNDPATSPIEVFAAGSGIVSITMGGAICASSNSKTWCWGTSVSGRLGNGILAYEIAPATVQLLPPQDLPAELFGDGFE